MLWPAGKLSNSIPKGSILPLRKGMFAVRARHKRVAVRKAFVVSLPLGVLVGGNRWLGSGLLKLGFACGLLFGLEKGTKLILKGVGEGRDMGLAVRGDRKGAPP